LLERVMGVECGKFLREQAERCRGLATNLTEPKINLTLRNLAEEYELRATQAVSGTGTRPGT
jgi:hypothetical protein